MNINEIIKQVDNGEIELEDDYEFEEFEYIDGIILLIGMKVKGYPVTVYFEEEESLSEYRDKLFNKEITLEEFQQFESRYNDIEDKFNYDKVVAYSTDDDGFVWL